MWERIKEFIMLPREETDIETMEMETYDDYLEDEKVLPFGIIGKRKEEKTAEVQPKRIQVSKPHNIEDAAQIIDDLLRGDCVMFNLEEMEHKNKQRMIDMITGYCYSKDQNIKQVNQDIYFVCE